MAAYCDIRVAHRELKQNSKANMKKQSKPTLKQIIQAAKKAGAQVKIDLQPKETSVEPLLIMAETMEAIYQLADTRKLDCISLAQVLLRRVNTNEVMFILTKLEREQIDKPILYKGHFTQPWFLHVFRVIDEIDTNSGHVLDCSGFSVKVPILK